jgi:hypothetical protein
MKSKFFDDFYDETNKSEISILITFFLTFSFLSLFVKQHFVRPVIFRAMKFIRTTNRKSVELRAIDRSSKDDKYFRLREVNSTRIQIILRESLDELVDSDTPHSILKFKIQCNSAMPSSNRRNHDVRL